MLAGAASNTPLQVNLDAAEKFLAALDPTAQRFTFQTFDDSKEKRPDLARVIHGTLEQCAPELEQLNKRGAGVYVTVNKTDLKGRSKEHIVHVRAVCADFDDPMPVHELGERLKGTGKPSIVVRSSIVGGNPKFHVYWSIDPADPLPLDEFTGCQSAIAERLRSDPAIKDLPRVMRLPGFYHLKGDPLMVELLHVSGLRFSAAKIKEVFPPVSGAHTNNSPKLALVGNTAMLNSDLTGGITKSAPQPETPENIARVKSMLEALPADCGYEQWRNIVWAIKATEWKCAEERAREWSMTAPDSYDAAAFDNVWHSFNEAGGIGFGTLVHHAKAAGWTEPAPVEQFTGSGNAVFKEFNTHNFVARVGGGVFVFNRNDQYILGGGMTFTAFSQLHAGKRVEGKPVSTKWLAHPDRPTFDGLTFNPSGKCPPNQFNLWRGWAVSPVKGNCQQILNHIIEVWCGGNKTQFDYVVRWLALLFQKPHIKPEVALVLRSPEGTGKTIIVSVLLKIVGVHGFTAQQREQVGGRFNGHLIDKVLVVLEETFFAGDHAAVAAIKALVTNTEIGYEAKGKDAFSASNYAHVISLTNATWAVPAGLDSRRWMVLDVSPSRCRDHEYFKALAAEIYNGGTEALLEYLLNVDLTGWNPRSFPDSRAMVEQRAETIRRTDPVAAWWIVVLANGAFTLDLGNVEWGDEVSASAMRTSYEQSSARSRGAPSWDGAAKRLRELVPPGMLGKSRKAEHGGRAWYYKLPTIDEAREHFKTVTGVDPCAE